MTETSKLSKTRTRPSTKPGPRTRPGTKLGIKTGTRPKTRTAARVIAMLATLIVCLAGASASSAWAQGDRASREEAKRHFRAGEQAYNAGQYMAAARAFEESYKLLPIPEIAFSTAQAYRLQYFVDKEPRWLERAISLYREYIDKQPKGGRRDVAITHLAELEPIFLRMKAEGASFGGALSAATQVVITSPTQDAKGTFAGQTSDLPMVLDLEPGSYEVSVEASGYAPTRRSFQALEGRFVTVEVTLEPQPAQVRIKTLSGASIAVDGRPEGETPLLQPLEVEQGTHFFAVSKRGHRPWSRQVQLTRGQTVDIEADLRITTQRKVSYGFVATAGVGVIAGAVTALLAASSNRQALELRDLHEDVGLTVPELNEYNQLRTDRNTRLAATIGLWGLAGLSASIGGLLYYLDTPRVERPPPAERQPTSPKADDKLRAISVNPALGPDMTGISVSGRF